MDSPTEEETRVLDKRPPQDRSGEISQNACLRVITGIAAGKLLRLDKPEAFIGRGPNNDLVLENNRVSRVHVKLTRDEAGRIRLVDLESTNGTTVQEEIMGSRYLCDGDKIVLGGSVVLKFSYIDSQEEALQERLYNEATHDALTGVFTRRAILARLEEEIELTRSQDKPITAAILDADLFKKVNDTYGHPAGDAVLKALAQRVSGSLRGRDCFGRFGGEEFALALPEVSAAAARPILERIREAVSRQPFTVPTPDGPREIQVTVSVGVAELSSSHEGGEDLLKTADQALYQAKAWGRNRVVLQGDQAPPEVTPAPPLGLEQRRRLRRLSTSQELLCRSQSGEFRATLRDVGTEGLGLNLATPLNVDAVLSIDLISNQEANPVAARVIWSRRWGELCQAGLRFLEGPEALQKSWLEPFLQELKAGEVPGRERRRHRRLAVDIPAQMRIADSVQSVRVTCLSQGGSLLLTSSPLENQAQIGIRLETEEEPWAAHVVHCSGPLQTGRDAGLWQVGIAFNELNPEQQKKLDKTLKIYSSD